MMLDNIHFIQYGIVTLGYLVTLASSGPVVGFFIGPFKPESSGSPPTEESPHSRFNIGSIIGKCENFIALTLIITDDITGLALIFTAKSIVRSEDMKRDPRYYLAGTMVNFSYSVLMGFLIRVTLSLLGHPL